jgi:CRP-like cAMP-binding protein
MINEISVMAGEINRLTLKTLENSIIWIIEREIILGLMAKHPELLI